MDDNESATNARVNQRVEERRLLPLTQDEMAHLPIVKAGTPLETSGVYLDLNHPERGPFKALAGQEAGSGDRYVARRDVDPVRGSGLHAAGDDEQRRQSVAQEVGAEREQRHRGDANHRECRGIAAQPRPLMRNRSA